MFTYQCPVRDHKTNSAALIILQKQTIEAPQKEKAMSRETNIKTERTMVSNIGESCSSLILCCSVLSQYEHHTATDAHLHYNCA